MTKRRPFTLRRMAQIALMAVVLSICAWITVPFTVPFTMQTFAVFLVTGLLGVKCGTLSVLVYLLLGAVGLPVFAGFKGGVGVLFGVTGGYLIGFLLTALAVGIITKHFGRSLPVLIAAMVLGLILCYAFGSLWFLTLYTKNTGPITVGGVLGMCVLPFLPVDGVKILLAAFLTRRLERFVKPA